MKYSTLTKLSTKYIIISCHFTVINNSVVLFPIQLRIVLVFTARLCLDVLLQLDCPHVVYTFSARMCFDALLQPTCSDDSFSYPH